MPNENLAVLRILDANLNRASEGLRVAEEHCRFVLNDEHLTAVTKKLRHELATATSSIEYHNRLVSRDSAHDVGLAVTTDTEYERLNTESIAIAALKRTQQALRCCEEYGKISSGDFAVQCERLRYETYTLEQLLHTNAEMKDRLTDKRLYVLVDCRETETNFGVLVASLIDAGVDILQLRDKAASDRVLLARARQLRELTRPTTTLMIVNDRPDIAALAQADGVHVGQEELAVSEVRRVVGPTMLIGVSTHAIEQARQAVCDGASYLGCGPTFPSTTKSFDAFAGTSYLEQVACEITLPSFAIGGINNTNVAEVRRAGCDRIAVSGCVINAANPAAAAMELKQRLTS